MFFAFKFIWLTNWSGFQTDIAIGRQTLWFAALNFHSGMFRDLVCTWTVKRVAWFLFFRVFTTGGARVCVITAPEAPSQTHVIHVMKTRLTALGPHRPLAPHDPLIWAGHIAPAGFCRVTLTRLDPWHSRWAQRRPDQTTWHCYINY